jgi:hypothetical protein
MGFIQLFFVKKLAIASFFNIMGALVEMEILWVS